MIDTETPKNTDTLNEEDGTTPPPTRSRMSRAMEHQAKRNIYLLAIGIVVVIGLLAFFGVTALQKLSEYTVNTKDNTHPDQKIDTTLLLPPSLNSLPYEATNSADVTIDGQAQDGDEVKLYINNTLAEKTIVKKDKSFTFSDVTLREGKNSIRAKVVKNGKESNLSDEVRVSYYSKPPTLEVTSPADGRAFNHDQNPILVSGTTDNDADIYVNDRMAIMQPNGKFEYTLNLKDGDNDIKVVAKDAAGNQTEKALKVRLQ